jgi:hypothetical protein
MISCSGPLLRCEYERRGADFRKELELQISSIRFVASLWVFALLLCSAAAAHGAEATAAKPGHDFTRPGWYLNAMGRLQLENFSFDAKDVVSSGDTDSSAGFSFAGGYRINEFLAAELQGEYLMDFFEDALQMGGAWLLGANVRAYYPLPWLDKRIQPVAIVGLSYFNAPLPDDYSNATAGYSHHSSFAIRAGFGFETYLTEHWVFLADGTYVMPATGKLKGFPFGSVGGGIAYRF